MIDFLNHPETQRIIEAALKEDIGPGDFTSLSTIPSGLHSRAKCFIKGEGILAGVTLAEKIAHTVDPNLQLELLIEDGTPVKYGDIAFFMEGDPRSILRAERIILNFMQRMSGIATMTMSVTDQLKGTSCNVLDTRKTTPLIRHMEKWAVHIGGGMNHRFGLYDMVMIKDNHIDYAGGIPQAIQSCKKYLEENDLDLKIEVETRDLEEVAKVLAEGGVHRIMLDNMDLDMMTQAVNMIGDLAETEASGGITPDTVAEVATTGVNYISMGALTHSIKSMDISLKAV